LIFNDCFTDLEVAEVESASKINHNSSHSQVYLVSNSSKDC